VIDAGNALSQQDLQKAAAAIVAGAGVEDWSAFPSSKYALVYKHKSNIFLKCFLPRSGMETVKKFFRGSRCVRSIRGTDLLLNAGLQAPATIARGKTAGVEWLASQTARGVGVADFLAYLTTIDNDIGEKIRSRLMAELGRQIARLHQQKIVHGDLRPNNVMLYLKPSWSERLATGGEEILQLTFIDNERTRRYWPIIPRRERIRNLVQIMMISDRSLNQQERALFISSYSRYCPINTEAAAKLEHTVMAIANTRLTAKRYNELFDQVLPAVLERVQTTSDNHCD
jgi:hypothetical protein